MVVFPGEYQAPALSSLTEDIVIKGNTLNVHLYFNILNQCSLCVLPCNWNELPFQHFYLHNFYSLPFLGENDLVM